MKYPIFKLILIFLICTVTYSIENYPNWFLYPKNFPDHYIGYGHRGANPEDDAEIMYCLYKACIVEGTLYMYNDLDYRDSEYFYDFSSKCLGEMDGRFVLTDDFVTNLILQEFIAIYSIDSLIQLASINIAVDTLKTPKWTEKTTWEDTQYYYGVGMYSSKMNENDAWKTAEERAIFEILNSISVEILNVKIFEKSESQSMEEVNALSVYYYIKSIEVRERWPDYTNKVFYTLVRIPKDKIIKK